MSSEHWLVAMTLLGALGHSGCADFSRGEPLSSIGSDAGSASGGSAAAGSSLTYGADIHPLLLDGCAACHSRGGAASDTQLQLSGSVSDDYESTLALIAPSSPDASRLLVKTSGRSHGGGTIYPSASPEYALILRWIGEGASP